MSFLTHDMSPVDPLVLKQQEKFEGDRKLDLIRQSRKKVESITMEDAPRQTSVMVENRRLLPVDHFAAGFNHFDGTDRPASTYSTASKHSRDSNTPENTLFGVSSHRRIQAPLTAPPSFSYGMKRIYNSDMTPARLSELHHRAEELRLISERQREESQIKKALEQVEKQRPEGWLLEKNVHQPVAGNGRIQRSFSYRDPHLQKSFDPQPPMTRHKHTLEQHANVTEEDREYLRQISRQMDEIRHKKEAEEAELKRAPEKSVADVVNDKIREPQPRITRVPGYDRQDHIQLNKELREQQREKLEKYREDLSRQIEESRQRAQNPDLLENDNIFKPHMIQHHANLIRSKMLEKPTDSPPEMYKPGDDGRNTELYKQLTEKNIPMADQLPGKQRPYRTISQEERERRAENQEKRQEMLEQLRHDREMLQEKLRQEEEMSANQGHPSIIPDGKHELKSFYGLKAAPENDVDDRVLMLRQKQKQEHGRLLKETGSYYEQYIKNSRRKEKEIDSELSKTYPFQWNKDKLDRQQQRLPLDNEIFIGLTPVKTLDHQEAKEFAESLKGQQNEIRQRRQTEVEGKIKDELVHLDNQLDVKMHKRDMEEKYRDKALRHMSKQDWTTDPSYRKARHDHIKMYHYLERPKYEGDE